MLWLFFFGTVIGSFINVIILRFEAGKLPLGRSVCPHCAKILTWYELVPIASYLIQKGRCRGCGVRISPQYPLVELATGLLFALVFLHIIGFSSPHNPQPTTYTRLILELSVWSTLLVITVYDLRTKLIPDAFSATFAVLAALILVINHSPLTTALWLNLAAGPILFLPFFILWYMSDGRWLGIGDGKLALGIGWLLGLSYGGSAIMFSFWIGAAVSLLFIAFQRIQSHLRRSSNPQPSTSNLTLKSEIPFGPYLVLGTFIVYVFNLSLWEILFY